MDRSEVWVPMFGSHLYDISSYGNVRRSDPNARGGTKNLPEMVNGVLYVRLRSIDISTRMLHPVAKCVIESFSEDDFPYGASIEHLDGDPMNCCLDNLRVVK